MVGLLIRPPTDERHVCGHNNVDEHLTMVRDEINNVSQLYRHCFALRVSSLNDASLSDVAAAAAATTTNYNNSYYDSTAACDQQWQLQQQRQQLL